MYKTILFFIAVTIFGCQAPVKKDPVPTVAFRTIDYVTVGKMMDSIRPPYVIDLSNQHKRVVFIGCDHNRDSTHPQYGIIQRYFDDLKPQIAFNEGGQIADSVHFLSLNDGVSHDGERGCLKYLSDKGGIKMMDGDVADSVEFSITLRRYPADQLLLYYLMERLVIPYLNGAYGKIPFEVIFDKAIQRWFVNQGFPLTLEQRSLVYFKQLYRQYMGTDLVLKLTMDIEKFDYINPNCQFCEIGRSSKMLRDSILLHKIDQALDSYDRVMITFGHGHAIAVEPALKDMVNKKR